MTTGSFKYDALKSSGGLGTVRENKPDDIFLVCASYESRSLAGVESLSEDYHAKKGIIYVNEEFIQGLDGQRTRKNMKQLEEQLEPHCDEVVIAMGSWLETDVQLDTLKEHLTVPSTDGPTVTIDTTTFNREALLVTLTLLKLRFASVSTRLIYISAEEHGEWLSRGHRLTRNILGFSGIIYSNKPTALVVLSGFETERTLNIIENLEPTKVLLGIGNPPTDQKFLNRTKEQQKIILNRQETENFEFAANDINKARIKLENIIDEYTPDWNIVIAPMSTKLSTVGTWMAAQKHPEVQVTYCLPGRYNTENYSTGRSEIYIDIINIQ